MPFDALAAAAVSDDLRRAVAGGRIQKIIQPSLLSVGLSIYSRGHEQWVLLSADARAARVHLASGRLAKAFATPSPFIMLLRKHLESAHVVEVEQIPQERILILTCAHHEQTTRLVAEMMGKHSNLILIDGAGRILGAVKTVTARQSRVRVVVPGAAFELPPMQVRSPAIFRPGPRIDPIADPDGFLSLLEEAPGTVSIRDALLGLLPGCSPFLANQIALRSGHLPSDRAAESQPDRLLAAAVELYQLYGTRDWRPCVFVNERTVRDFAPYQPLGESNIRDTASISDAIERCLGENESRDALAAQRQAVLAQIDRARSGLARKLTSLREGLAAAAETEAAMETGQLILAYQHAIEPGTDRVYIADLDRTIALDPKLSPVQNAERAFHRYRKLQEARRRLPTLMRETESELARLDDLATFVRLADSEADLRDIQGDSQGGDREPAAGATRRKRSSRRGPSQFELDGYTALVGRHGRENEELTFRLAGRDDLWLHVRERTGAHVILRTGGRQPPESVLEAAAGLAAYFSEGRSDTRVDVDVTQVRNVRRIPGGPPGRVTYSSFRTIRAAPTTSPWRPKRRN